MPVISLSSPSLSLLITTSLTDSHKKRRKQKKTRIARCHAHSLRCDKGVLFDGGQDIRKLDFGCKGVPMVDDWHSLRAIPAVHWENKSKHRHMHATSFYLLSFKDKENQQMCVSDGTIVGSVCFKANKIYNKQVLFIETCLTRVC